MTNINSKKNYQRLFHVQGLLFLICDIWMSHYRTLDTLVTVLKDDYTSYLPKKSFDTCLKAGMRLYSDKRQFNVFKTEFKNYERSLDKFYKISIKSKKFSKAQLTEFLEMSSKLFYFYSKTEFFYTDAAYALLFKKKNLQLKNNLRQLGQVKNQGRELLNRVFFGKKGYLNIVLSSLSKRFEVVERELMQYSKAELIDLFEGKYAQNKSIIDRTRGFVMMGQHNNLVVISGNAALKQINKLQKPSRTGREQVIKGVIANKGIVKGRVRRIVSGFDNYDDLRRMMAKMKKGDILVSETTSPELMPAILKAGAIVTDQGGLMSHAAIVSRELGIPCIVGTLNATKLLKDGDLVEVDASKGIVKII